MYVYILRYVYCTLISYFAACYLGVAFYVQV